VTHNQIYDQHNELVAEQVFHGKHAAILVGGKVYLDDVHMPYMTFLEARKAAQTRHSLDLISAAHGRTVLPLIGAVLYVLGFATAAALLWWGMRG
jgi:hypothetical protein